MPTRVWIASSIGSLIFAPIPLLWGAELISYSVAIFSCMGALAGWWISAQRRNVMKTSEWKPDHALFVRRRLIDGTISKRDEHLMRRKVNGEFQYRRMTEDELSDLTSRWAI